MSKARRAKVAGLGMFAAVTVAAPMVYFWFQGDPGKSPEPPVVLERVVGGPFSLNDQWGRIFNETHLRNHYSLLFFGYSSCPELCSTQLTTLTKIAPQLRAKTPDIQVVFITIDPERDKPDQLKKYMSAYDSNFIALTGSIDEIVRVAKIYHIDYARAKPLSEDAKADPSIADSYQMDHTTVIYLIDHQGQVIASFPHTTDGEALLRDVSKSIATGQPKLD